MDDQALIFRVPEGIVVVLGCAHAGVVNTLEYVNQLTGGEKIHAVIGGSHLISASPQRMQKTIAYFQKHDIQKIMLSHCTGLKAFSELACAIPGRCSWPGVGTRNELPRRKQRGIIGNIINFSPQAAGNLTRRD